MQKTVSRDNLGYLGEEYQKLLLKAFIEDKDFFKSIEPIVDQNMFTIDELKRLVGFMKERFEKVGTVPTYYDMELMVKSKITEPITMSKALALLKFLKESENTNGLDLIETECEHFFKQQNLTKAINKATQIIKTGDINRYEEIEGLVQEALNVNTKQDWDIHTPDEFLDAALSDEFRDTIPTGVDKIDKILMGGLGKGELGVIISPSGIGKTSATSGFATYAATFATEANNENGYKIFHLFFEDKETAILRKYYAYLTGYESSSMSDPTIRSAVWQMIKEDEGIKTKRKMLDANIRLKRAETGGYTCSDLSRDLDHMISIGFKPDMVIVDYFECLKVERSNSGDDKWSREELTIRRLESIAHKYNVALWVPVQGTKDSMNVEYVGMNQGGGSVAKVQVGHIILSFARTDEMKAKNKMNIFLHKFRGGAITQTQFIGVTFNNGTCRFDMTESEMVDKTLDFQQNQSSKQLTASIARTVYETSKVKK